MLTCVPWTASTQHHRTLDLKKSTKLFIEPEECIDCGVCEPECPVEAIFMEEDVPEEWTHFTQLNADYFQ